MVAGEFYPSLPTELKDFIEQHKYTGEKINCFSLVIPNGHYSFSGDLLVKTLSAVTLPEQVILLGVNHSGFGEDISVWTEGDWETPFGDLETDTVTAYEIIRCSSARADVLAHIREYSIENVLPVLKYLNPNIKIIPISMSGMPHFKLRAFATDISKFLLNGVGLIACSLCVTGENPESLVKYNDMVIDSILSVDGEALNEIVMEKGAGMEGVYPVCACLMANFLAGATTGRLIGRKPGAVGVAIY